ncbi:MAG: hypothetical protein WC401_12410 [Bacteroidales bacterium]|jgi:hypothetical protein
MKFETIAGHKIFFDETYYLAYSGGMREMSAKDQKEYNKLLTLPFGLQRQEIRKLGPDKNPKLVPVKGKLILQFIIDGKFAPFFDLYFEKTKTLQINDLVVYESMKAKSYDVAMR